MVRLLGLVSLVMASQAMAANTIEQAVKTCIQVVHNSRYESFDAFFNPASKSVENNITYVYERAASMRMIFCALSRCLTLSRTTSLARNPQP